MVKCGHINTRLVTAVVRQVGGWENFKEIAKDVSEHGANAGFSGFTYYTDTLKFYRNNQKEIRELVAHTASDLGEDPVMMVNNFNCLVGRTNTNAVGKTLYGTKANHDTNVANALAWYALEEVSRAYVDYEEAAV